MENITVNYLKELQNPEIPAKQTPETKELVRIVYNPIIKYRTGSETEVIRIVQEEDVTVIDFVHHANPRYINGGWMKIQPGCFIRPVGSADKLLMIKAVNIPVSPNKHSYRSKQECLYYTLVFPALPKNTTHIDIIEKEGADGVYLDYPKSEEWRYGNYYGVAMSKVKSQVINNHN